MVDRLEELWTHTDALLEQLQRLERGLAGLTGGERSVQTVPGEDVSRKGRTVYNLENQVYRTEDVVDDLAAARKGRTEQGEWIVNRLGAMGDALESPGRPGGEPETGAERRGGAPLAVRLEQADRAVSAFSAGGWNREKGAGQRGGTASPGRYRPAGTRLQGAETLGEDWSGPEIQRPSGGGPDWVEQTDKAFRRDSRRYDGGFYLY